MTGGLALALAALLGSWACACGGSEFTTAPGSLEAGDEDTSAESGAEAGSPPGDALLCVMPPTAVGNEGSFCATESAILNRCGECEACRQSDLNNCVAFGDGLSGQFKAALATCKDRVPCGAFSEYATDPCITALLQNPTPTQAQLDAQKGYCSACQSNVADCNNFFAVSSDGGANGAGYVLLLVSDAVATRVTTQCSGGLNCNPAVYQFCSYQRFCGGTGPDACDGGLCPR